MKAKSSIHLSLLLTFLLPLLSTGDEWLTSSTSIQEREVLLNEQDDTMVKKNNSTLSSYSSSSSSSSYTTEDERSSRIIGGSNVPANKYPWFARLTGNGGRYWWGCGGSLITPEYVLTAAHCVDGSTSGIGAMIGALQSPYTSSNGGQAPAQYRSGVRVFKHPNYVPGPEINDFALIRLNSRVSIQPVNVDQDNLSGSYANGKHNLWPIGFGTTNENTDAYTSRLMHVETKYVDNSRCNSMYGASRIKTNMMCTADPGQDACYGDSGGPLFDSDSNTVVGVVSWGDGCADSRYPGVYSRISDQWDAWIKPTICANHSNPKPDFCQFTSSGDCANPRYAVLEVTVDTDSKSSSQNFFVVKRRPYKKMKRKKMWQENV
jgi:secreted trypsin-like serine protease